MIYFRQKIKNKTDFGRKPLRGIDGIYFSVKERKVLTEISQARKNFAIGENFARIFHYPKNIFKAIWSGLKNLWGKIPRKYGMAFVFAAIMIFVLSAAFLIPTIFKSQADVFTILKTWTGQTDFDNNASTVNLATIKTNVDIASVPGSVKLSTSPLSVTQTDDGTTNTGFKLSGYAASNVDISGAGSSALVQSGIIGTGGNYSLGVGATQSCAVKGDGTAYCWGNNASGQLGDGTTNSASAPVQVHGTGNAGYLTDVSAIASGNNHTCAVKNDGTVWCWGTDASGQLGDGTNSANITTPVQVLGGEAGGTYLSGIVNISLGYNNTCAVKNDGTIYCWGYNYIGQLGDGTGTARNTPVQVCSAGNAATDGTCNNSFLTGISKVITSAFSTCALKSSDGSVYCWGNNSGGILGYLANGTWDNAAHPVPVQVPGGEAGGTYLTGIVDISLTKGQPAGYRNSACAVKSDGTVFCWGVAPGVDLYGQLGDGTTNSNITPVQVCSPGNTATDGTCNGSFLTGISKISGSFFSTCAVKSSDGSVYCWGRNGQGQLGDNTTTQRNVPTQVLGVGGAGYLTGINNVSGAAGGGSTRGSFCASNNNGAVYCWGDNYYSELGDDTGIQRSIPVSVKGLTTGYLTGAAANSNSISSGVDSSCTLKSSDGTVYCWGSNSYGQLGNGSTINKYTPTRVIGVGSSGYLTGMSLIAAGYRYSCAVKSSDGSVYCWGDNAYGNLGDNTTTQRNAPVQVLGVGGAGYLTGISSISTNGFTNAGANYTTCAVKSSDGSVYCWGRNVVGTIGDNTTNNSSVPVQVHGVSDSGFLTGISAISVGAFHVCAVKSSDGSVYCWGYNSNGGLGDNSTTQELTPVQVHGVNNSGYLTGVNAVSSGGLYTCAVKSDGTAYCWGYGNLGNLGDNGSSQRLTPVQVHGVSNSGYLTGVSAISAASKNDTGNYTCAVKSDGTAYCWGWNGSFGLGDGTTNAPAVPVQVHGVNDSGYLTGISAISVGAFHVCAVKSSDGSVYCWGSNGYGNLGDNTTTTRLTPVQVYNIPGDSLNLSTTVYYSSGTYTSGYIDLGNTTADFSTLSWTQAGSYASTSIKVRTSDSPTMSGAPDWSTCQNISNGGLISSGNCSTAGHRYLQYQSIINTSNSAYSASVDNVALSAYRYSSSGTVSKLLVDAGSDAVFTGITWNKSLPNSTAIKFRTRGITAAQCTSYGSCAAAWTALSGSLAWSKCDNTTGLNAGNCSGDYYGNSGAYITANNATATYPVYRYLEIEATLATSDGSVTPRLDDFTVGYKINTAPTVSQTITPIQIASGAKSGLVHLTYQVSDLDTGEGINQSNFVNTSFKYYNGSSWSNAVTFLKPDGITPAGAVDGVGTHVPVTDSASTFDLYWDAKTDAPDIFLNNTAKLRVIVDDGEALNSSASADSGVFVLDTKSPQTPTISIDRSKSSERIKIGITDDSASGVQYALAFPNATVEGGDACDFSSPSWQAFTYPQMNVDFPGNVDNSDDVRKVCVLFKDRYDNVSNNLANYAIAPRTPVSFQYYDVSNPIANDYRIFLSWSVPETSLAEGTGEFSQYEIDRCDDLKTNLACSPTENYKTITSKTENFVTETNDVDPTNMNPDNRYCYRIRFKDKNPDPDSDYSKWSETLCAVPGSGTSSLTKNVSIKWYSDTDNNLNVPPNRIYTTQATIKWQTVDAASPSEALLADSKVEWKKVGSGDAWESYSAPSYVSEHIITISGLLPDTEYEYRVSSTAPWNVMDLQDGLATFTTKSGPVIESVIPISIGNNSAIIEWDTRTQKSPDGSPIATSSVIWFSTSIDANGDLISPQNGICTVGYTNHHSCTISNLDSGRPYYYYVYSAEAPPSDGYSVDTNGGSFYAFTTTTDTTPPVIMPGDNPLILTDTQAAISWETDERAESWLLYGTATNSIGYIAPTANFDPNNSEHNPYALFLANSNSDLSHTFVMSLDSLAPAMGYYYRLVSQDTSGNVRVSPEYSFTTLEKQTNHPELVDPGDPAVAQYSDTEAVVYLSTANTDSTSKLCYGTFEISDMDACANHIDITDATRNHYYHLSGLSASTAYHLKTKITDSQNGSVDFTSSDVTFTTKKIQVDQPAPPDPLTTISTPDSADIAKSYNYAIVSWTTDQAANQSLACGTDSGNYTDTTDDLTHYNTTHSLKLIGLMADTKYHCKVTSIGESGSPIKVSDEFSFTTLKTQVDQHGPLSEITNVTESVITDINTVSSFETDQPALCLAEVTTAQGSYDNPLIYQEDGYEQKKNYNLAHSINFTGLIFSTKYYYKLSCRDDLDTVVSDPVEHSFTTSEKLYTEAGIGALGDHTAPALTNIKSGVITGESATITWDTDEKTSGSVAYGIGSGTYENMASDYLVNSDPANYVTAHSVVINGLAPANKYYFVALSFDASGNVAKSSESTFTTAAPSSLSSINVSSLNLNQATITWKTSQKATSTVEYGLTDQYGQKKEDSTMATDHSVSLSGLQSAQTYHFRVSGRDATNNLYSSGDYTFQPKSPPQISGVKVVNVTEHEATVRFITNVPTDATVVYNDVKNPENSGSQGNPQLISTHEIILKNLVPGTNLTLSIKARDEQGSETDQPGPNFTTGKDETPPQIDKILTDTALTQNDQVQTIISWTTDEPASTSLIYKESINGEEKEAQISDNYTTNHIAVSTLFKPGVVYYFRVKSVDVSGNDAVSQDYALLTPKRRENIIQIIVSNFQGIFSWMKF